MTKFRARVEAVGGGGHYVLVPDDVAAKAGLAYRARVRGTLDGAPYRSSLMKYGGKYHLGVHKATLAAANAQAGDRVAIAIELDDEALPEDTVPPLLAAALQKDAAAKRAWAALAPSHRREHVKAINEAKRDETRRARVERALQMLRERPRRR
ncbi:MAG TPA: YdeI/OmpD-associated family protein [Polyangia bacterium]